MGVLTVVFGLCFELQNPSCRPILLEKQVSLFMHIAELIERIGSQIPGFRSVIRLRKFHHDWIRFVPPGHFYSPLPSREDIDAWSRTRRADANQLGLESKIDSQKELLTMLAANYPTIPFESKATSHCRYYFDNPFFTYADAIFLHLLIRHLKPRRIVEVGSGFSSAVMLDTLEQFGDGSTQLTFIEPNAGRLRSLFRSHDAAHTTIERRVQEVPYEIFTALQPGDILFVDSSHVSKVGSDVNFLIFEVFPRLRAGVWIHIHDISPDFEYSEESLRDGVAWNEAYIIRAFLLFNSAFEIALHGPFCISKWPEWFGRNMPNCLKNSGSSLWIRRTSS
jgi:hypothetical protein